MNKRTNERQNVNERQTVSPNACISGHIQPRADANTATFCFFLRFQTCTHTVPAWLGFVYLEQAFSQRDT
jgi:hypothetical protein